MKLPAANPAPAQLTASCIERTRYTH